MSSNNNSRDSTEIIQTQSKPQEAGSKVTELTGQQVNTVIAIEKDMSTRGAYALILVEAMMADVQRCEVILNEVILDIEPDAGSQFTNLAPLALYNPLGAQESTSPSFTRRSLPYRPGMFVSSTRAELTEYSLVGHFAQRRCYIEQCGQIQTP